MHHQLRAGAAQQSNRLIELADQRHTFCACRQLLVTIAEARFSLRQQIPAVAVIFVAKGVPVEDFRRFRRLSAL